MFDNPTVKPISTVERIASLDFLRGIAIFGILFINIESFVYPNPWSSWQYGYEGALDHTARFWIYFLTQGKFYTLFALLFGVGFAIFLDRIESKNRNISGLDIYARRLLWLFIFGIIHAYFIWDGDILYHYAICGLFLIPFRSMKSMTVLIALFILMLFPLINSYDNISNRQDRFQKYQEALNKSEEIRTNDESHLIESWQSRYSPKTADAGSPETPRKSYWDGVKDSFNHIKVHRGSFYYDSLIFSTLIVMLTGMLLYRSGIFTDYTRWNHYWLITLGLLAFGGYINYLRYYQWTYLDHVPVLKTWKAFAFTYNKEILGIAYALLFNGIYQKFMKHRNTSFINAVGKTALSNYILQSILLGLLFYGYGFGLFNQFSRAELPVFVIGIWAVQITLTVIWLKFHHQGPLEALWRRLTYRQFRR